MVYCLMYDHVHPSEQPLIPGIYSTKLLFGKDYDFRLKCDKELIQNFRYYQQEFSDHLRQLLEELFSPEHPFCQTDNEKEMPDLQLCRNMPQVKTRKATV